jgi:phage-related protein
MRINRTFSLPVPLVIKLKTQRNQSAVVERAVSKYLNEKDEFSLMDIPTKQLLSVLTNRDDLSPIVRATIQAQLSTS